MNKPIDPRAVLAPKTTRSGAEDRRTSPRPADSASAPVLSNAVDAMMQAAVRAGMPGKDARAAARNALQTLVVAVEEAVEAREAVNPDYCASRQHVVAMLDALDRACWDSA